MLRRLLFLNCVLTDFAGFIVIFAVSRRLAELESSQWYLGLVGAGVSLSAGVGSLAGGWLAHRFDGRTWFLIGAVLLTCSTGACGVSSPGDAWFLPAYWLLGIGIGLLYPPLVGWLNRGETGHAHVAGVSRTLILFCISWNVGLMCGQLTAGSLFSWGDWWIYGVALAIAIINIVVAAIAASLVRPFSPESAGATSVAAGDAQLAASFKRLSWIANLGGMFGGSMVIHLLPGLAVAIGIPPDDHGRLLGCWRAVVIATYLVLHVTRFWHYRIAVALGSQMLAATDLVLVASADSGPCCWSGLSLLGQLGVQPISPDCSTARSAAQHSAAGEAALQGDAGNGDGNRDVHQRRSRIRDQRAGAHLLAAGVLLLLSTIQYGCGSGQPQCRNPLR
ncbi:MAG: MFS transporter [Planctomycetaceae bacterium]